jgi:hypothetical protein
MGGPATEHARWPLRTKPKLLAVRCVLCVLLPLFSLYVQYVLEPHCQIAA